jgi:hypothetical protein
VKCELVSRRPITRGSVLGRWGISCRRTWDHRSRLTATTAQASRRSAHPQSRSLGMAVLGRRWLPLNKGMVSVLALSRQDDVPDPQARQRTTRGPAKIEKPSPAVAPRHCLGELGLWGDDSERPALVSPLCLRSPGQGGILHRRQSRSTRCRGCAMISVSASRRVVGGRSLCVFGGCRLVWSGTEIRSEPVFSRRGLPSEDNEGMKISSWIPRARLTSQAALATALVLLWTNCRRPVSRASGRPCGRAKNRSVPCAGTLLVGTG